MSQQNILFSRFCASQHDLLLSISCKFRHFHQKNRHVTTKHVFQQILCFSAFHVSFTISVQKNRHVTTKHAFQQILCFSAFHVSFAISIKKIDMSQQNMLFSRICASQHFM